jgi:NAD(P)-dependent dehydrogenase (short-subunit alcohol dehydrogenase family)
MNPMDLTDRAIMVTGASSGIGRATAVALGQLGAQVVLVGRNRDRLAETLGMLEGSRHAVELCDLTQTDDLPEWMKGVVGRTGQLSGVVHCAGAQVLMPLRVLKTKHIEDLLRINVVSSIMLAKAFRQKGVATPGSGIVFVSSVMGDVGSPGRSAYCASKSALHSLTRALALELAADRIRVNCVAPGAVQTEMVADMKDALGEARLGEVVRQHPLGLGTPRDVALAIAFLLAETGRWITGSIQFVDGGYTAQ